MPRVRWLYHAVSLVVLAICLWGVLEQSRVAALPSRFEARHLEYPVRVGDAVAGSPGELRAIVQRYRPGTVVEVASRTSTLPIRLSRAFAFPRILISLVCGLFLWAVATFTLASRVDRGPVRDLYWGFHAYAMAVAIGGVYLPAEPLAPAMLLAFIRIAVMVLLPVLFLHFACCFPRRRSFLDRHPWVFPVLFASVTAAVLLQDGAALRWAVAPDPGRWRALALTSRLADLILIGADGAGCFVLFQNTRRVELERERRQVKWVLWGVLFGATPYAFLYLLPAILLGRPAIPIELGRLASIVIPLSFGIAVVRHKFLDIDIIIRRSLIYGVLAGGMGLLYFGIVVLAGHWVERRNPGAAPYLPVVAAIVAVLLFRPTRVALGRWVDRTFFKIRYNYAQALSAFRLAAPGVASQRELAGRTHVFLEQQLGPKRLLVLVPGAGGRSGPAPGDGAWVAGDPGAFGLERHRSRVAAAGTTSLPEIESAEFPAALRRAGYLLAEPIAVEGRVFGWILLGEKRSERRYIQEEMDLVAATSAEAARALDRLELVQHAAEESRERERLHEIDRHKTEFLSRVAHDLRTPLASVTWSVQNLLDGVVGPTDERMVTYLRSIQASTAQLARLVSNLLEISRLELRRTPPAPEPVDWRAVVEESVAALTPLAQSKRVRIDSRSEAGLGPVGGHRDKLGEIVTNLLENAVKYAPPGSTIEIRLGGAGSGHQRLTVRDHGPGVDPAERDAIFERFHQGAPSPYSDQRGFGLGLFVVKSYAEHLRGEVTACNHPEGGAMFTCDLPEWSARVVSP